MTETYILFIFGALLSSIGGMIAFILHGIKGEIKDVNDKLEKIEGDLHRRVSEVDRRHQDHMVEIDQRLAKVEARWDLQHAR